MKHEPESLVSVTYVSSAAPGFTVQDLTDIVRSARRNNERLGITGMLLHKDGNFMQTLEGSEESINTLLNAIEQDPRHRGFIRLLTKPIAERSFGSWSMAFQDLSNLSPEDLAAFSPFLTSSLLDEAFRSESELCFKLMLSFKANIR